jgi:hypothetical protein
MAPSISPIPDCPSPKSTQILLIANERPNANAKMKIRAMKMEEKKEERKGGKEKRQKNSVMKLK